MDIIVCVKNARHIVGEPELAISHDGLSLDLDRLFFEFNESDKYALEEARIIKENFGGSITVITVEASRPSAEDVLTKCLALGADDAIGLVDINFTGSDAHAISKILHSAIKNMRFGLVLTGCIASDNGYSQVGVQLGQYLGIPHASYVTKVDIRNKYSTVRRELEDGLSEVLDIELPAVITIQTGINVPRYASFKRLLEAKRKKIKFLNMIDLGLRENEVGETGSRAKIEKLFVPRVGERTRILDGALDEKVNKLFKILKEKEFI